MDLILVRWLRFPSATIADEEGPSPPGFGLDQEEYWTAQCQVVPWCAVPFLDDEFLGQVPTVGLGSDSFSLFTLVSVCRVPWSSSADEEYVVQVAEIEEHEWSPQYQSVPWVPLVFADDEALGLAYFYLDHDDPWCPQYQSVPWLPLPFTDEEILCWFFDDEREWTAAYQSIVWNPGIFLDDEALQQVLFLLEEGQAWLAEYQFIPWISCPFTDDEILWPLAHFFLDHEQAWVPQRQALPWQALVFDDNEQQWSLPAPPLTGGVYIPIFRPRRR